MVDLSYLSAFGNKNKRLVLNIHSTRNTNKYQLIAAKANILCFTLSSNAYTFQIRNQSLFLYLPLAQQEERVVILCFCIFRQHGKKLEQ
jgi:hypothetical protein